MPQRQLTDQEARETSINIPASPTPAPQELTAEEEELAHA
jgi:hypothetical protein